MRQRPTLADYAVIAISPALIMLMVGSLVFFLIEVFYAGQYGTRLCYIMGLFVLAAVLIGRISIEEGREYASLFAIALGLATTLATLKYVQFHGPLASISPLVTLSLVGLIWWSADKLTWDCTVIDEQQDVSGEGLLQTTGMDGDGSDGSVTGGAAEPVDGTTAREPTPSLTWRQKFVQYRRRPHAPGVWVLYFALAALPIFGFGQWFGRQELNSRRYVFQLLVVYLASGLGLLLTTSFLGLRRYLRQRRLSMPVEMAGSWFGVGATMIVAVLLVCMLLPRRNPEYSISHLSAFAGSRDLSPSEMGFGDDGPEDDELASQQVSRPDGETESDQPGQGQGTSDGGDSDSSGESNRKSRQTGEQKDESGQGQSKSKSKSKSKSEGESGGQRRDRSGERQDSEQSSSSDRQDNRENSERSQSGDSQSRSGQDRTDSQSQDRSRSSNARQSNQGQRGDTSQLMSNLGWGLGGLVKFIYWIVTIVIVVFFVWRYWPQVVAAVRNFAQALQDFWDRLWGRQRLPQEPLDDAPRMPTESYRSFAEYPNPFLAGMVDRYTLRQLVRYSFEAFEAWSRERGVPRDPEQTPHEFAQAVSRREKALAKEGPRLAELYCRTAYGQDALPKASLQHLRRFWERVGES